jgi:hypothetical protein
MKNYFATIVLLLALMFSFQSCYVNRTTIGDGPVGKSGDKVQYSKTKQVYLFWGGIAVGQGQPATPTAPHYQVKTSFNFWDGVISALTGGIVSTRSVKIYTKNDK